MKDVNNGKISVLFVTDQSMFDGFICALYSLLCNLMSAKKTIVYVFDCGISDESWIFIEQHVIPRFDDVVVVRKRILLDQFFKLPKLNSSLAPYARLLAPIYIDDELVLYCDADMYIGRNIADLFDQKYIENIVAAVEDWNIPQLSVSSENEVQLFKDVGANLNESYFNSGFLLMNLSKMREKKFCEWIFSTIAKYGDKLSYYDQTLLNMYSASEEKIKSLPSIWNYPHYKWDNNNEGANVVIHYLGYTHGKPWIIERYSSSARIIYDLFKHINYNFEFNVIKENRQKEKRIWGVRNLFYLLLKYIYFYKKKNNMELKKISVALTSALEKFFIRTQESDSKSVIVDEIEKKWI